MYRRYNYDNGNIIFSYKEYKKMVKKVYVKKVVKRKTVAKRMVNKVNKNELYAKGKNATSSLVSRSFNFFPDQLKFKTKTVVNILAQGAGTGYTFKGNSIHLIGPQTSWSGAFASNVPSGLYYLLSGQTIAGAVAPYGQYRILGSTMRVHMITGSSNTISSRWYILPSVNASLNSLQYSQIAEQPRAKVYDLPVNSSNNGVTMRHSANTLEMYGARYKSAIDDNAYTGIAGSDPAAPFYWHIGWVTADGTTSATTQLTVEIIHDIELFNKNTFTSSVPV